ncbi:MAG: hypothetical protein OXE73_07410, partial [Gammaproteobacteria bacterium]|nr:hypothetical protein [Gammaproteobacteria bacterium]
MARRKKPKAIKTITHPDRRKNIPTSEYQAAMKHDERHPVQVAYERRNRDLDPQLVWRGKDKQDEEPLVAQAPPLYIQEKIHPKALLDSDMTPESWTSDVCEVDLWKGAAQGRPGRPEGGCHGETEVHAEAEGAGG